jgi:hypothetical protein
MEPSFLEALARHFEVYAAKAKAVSSESASQWKDAAWEVRDHANRFRYVFINDIANTIAECRYMSTKGQAEEIVKIFIGAEDKPNEDAETSKPVDVSNRDSSSYAEGVRTTLETVLTASTAVTPDYVLVNGVRYDKAK